MRILILIVFFGLYINPVLSQQEIKVQPYTIETTYEKLKKNYPFIIPISDLESDKIIAEKGIIYKEVGDSQLKMDIYSPNDESKTSYPTVLLIHGGGWITGSRENERVMAQHLALNGYVAITVSYRLSPVAKYPAGVLDLKSAIRWMRINAKTYHINPDKIAVLGASAGAHLATLIGVTPNSSIYGFDSEISDEVQAIVNIDGIVSFIHPEAAAEGKSAGIWLDGSREENPKNWKEASALEYVDNSAPPILFINSARPRFHAGRDDMILLLNEYKIYSEVHTFPNSPHSFWLMNPWFDDTLNYVVSFLEKTLKNE